jgi:inner membrane protease ATP23
MDARKGEGKRAQPTYNDSSHASPSGDPGTALPRAAGSVCSTERNPSSSAPVADPQENPSDTRFIGATAAHCEHMVEYAMRREPFVKFMIEKLAESGCKVGDDFFKIRHCDAQVGGGFRAPDGVIMCYNHLASQEEVTHALTHELIHAYDHCRAKNLDWCNCEHHACSEIRAASLSGDCNFKMELLRGHYNIAKQHQACVKRRALLSVSMNPYCQGKGVAEAAVERAFATCFNDTRPFDRRP